ncbi:3-hydroxyacyl-CoA dehydrogenase NAD-binding domain-containing protein [Pseudogemmobacter humi]|uniref:L-carnitine dehydrogenase n=1 Tax=Pseudogemmobacter humi TaxID=2483812 RepID=A0A3P5X507_9RHOB|nr:3-hydroxyacyl-CoA dehydrogenase NAD-binding domain-containing protein [Pseudogemmobacter humi]VDC22354.1 L-carnitine dehydrogenase [Pseudogemmobacter humi]
MARDELRKDIALPNIAIIGTGLIGCSWAALMAGAGRRVAIYDTRPEAGAAFLEFWNGVKPALVELGLAQPEQEPDFRIASSLDEALREADFVFECIPERLDLKRALYSEMEPLLKPQAIVATSSSGLKLSDLQTGWQNPARIIIGHPFNPPHLVPLVELYANDRTDPDVLPAARGLYESCGKVAITLKREVMGHVANRLQAAIWREAIHLVEADVASVEDVNAAVWAGPGLRWAIMGPHMLLHLGGGAGGLGAYCEQFTQSYTEWWEDLGKPQLTPETIATLVAGLSEEIAGRDYATLRQQRDRQLVAVLKALAETRQSPATAPVAG